MALTEARSVHQVPVGGLLYKQVRLHLLQFKTAQPLNRKTHILVPKKGPFISVFKFYMHDKCIRWWICMNLIILFHI